MRSPSDPGLPIVTLTNLAIRLRTFWHSATIYLLFTNFDVCIVDY